MIQLEKPNKANVIGDVETSSFGISETDQGHVISILRDRLYSDKIAAPIREYGTNALDANREAGNGKAIKVTAPTQAVPTLSIRDYGSGISEDDMRNKYVQYGHSSKRDSNAAIGQLGLGCKSGYAYSNTFRVVSYFNGEAKTYVCHLDDDNKGSISKIGTVPTTETGLEVLIDVKPSEVNTFQEKIRTVMQYFSPRPICNITIPEVYYTEKGKHWGLRNGGSYNNPPEAIMGCIAYPINPDIATTPAQTALLSLPLDIEFPIGALEISASRESLEYKSVTKKCILNRLNAIEAELTAEMKAKFDALTDTMSARKMFRTLSSTGSVSSYLVNKTFTQWKNHDLTTSSFFCNSLGDSWKKTQPDARIYLHTPHAKNILRQNTNRSWAWSVEYSNVVVLHNDSAATTWTKRFANWRSTNYNPSAIIITGTEDNLNEYLNFYGLDGVEVITLSKISAGNVDIALEEEDTWGTTSVSISAEELAARAARLQKHKTKVFLLENATLGKHPKSDNWQQATIDLENDEGYYMLINAFQPQEATDLEYLQLLVALDIEIGPIYGVKKDLKDKMGANWKPFSEYAIEKLRTYIKDSDKFDALKGQTLAAYGVIPAEADADIESELPDPDIIKAVKAIRKSKQAYHSLSYSDQRIITRISLLLEPLKLDINEDLELVKHVEARYFFLKAVSFFSGNGKMLCRSKEVLSELGEYIKMKQEQNNE